MKTGVEINILRKGDGMSGSIEVIVGGMYSGKTEELLRRVRRAQIAGQKVLVIKPSIDNRYSESDVVSHHGSKITSYAIKEINKMSYDMTKDKDVIAIDEGQFFGTPLVNCCQYLADQGYRIIVAGLDMDFNRRPFHPMQELMAMAEEVTKLRAICAVCGKDGTYSYKTNQSSNDQVQVGGKEMYQARCRKCYLAEKTEI